MPTLPPPCHSLPHLVDELVFFDPLLCPFRVEYKLFPATPGLGPGYGNEVGTDSPAFDDLVRDTLVGEFEVPLRLLKGRVQDRIFDDDLGHRRIRRGFD